MLLLIYFLVAVLCCGVITVYVGYCDYKRLPSLTLHDIMMFSLFWPLVVVGSIPYALYAFGQQLARRNPLPKAKVEMIPFAPRRDHKLGRCTCSECEVDRYLKLKP